MPNYITGILKILLVFMGIGLFLGIFCPQIIKVTESRNSCWFESIKHQQLYACLQ
jgi:hypothetical protein